MVASTAESPLQGRQVGSADREAPDGTDSSAEDIKPSAVTTQASVRTNSDLNPWGVCRSGNSDVKRASTNPVWSAGNPYWATVRHAAAAETLGRTPCDGGCRATFIAAYVRGSFSVCAGGMGRSIWSFGSQRETASEIGPVIETVGGWEDGLPACLTEVEVEQAVASKTAAAAAGARTRIYQTLRSRGGISSQV